MSEIQRWGGLLESEAQSIGQRIETAVAAQQAVVVARAAAAAPARTGTLRGSIRPLGSGLIRRVRAGSGKAYYAPFQEFGTRKMTANPFLLIQANRAARVEFEGRVQTAIDKGEIYA
jgi:HK97 gp10 family phage protein